jgi:2-polyprenyl-6-methoxyphenol hydroxylase-like FAD-dependent oxidoreductase
MTRSQNTGKRALVIGCGIGGPVAAMALQKVGIDATVFEAYDGSAEFVGSFLNTASNGLDALKAVDAHTEVLARGFPTPRMVMWSGSGKRLGRSPTASDCRTARSASRSNAVICTARFDARPFDEGSGSTKTKGSYQPSRRVEG